MKEIQKKALEIMDRRNAGAIRTAIGWVWKNDVRLSDEAAEAVILKVAQDEIPDEESPEIQDPTVDRIEQVKDEAPLFRHRGHYQVRRHV